MSTIARQQEQMREAMKTTMGNLMPLGMPMGIPAVLPPGLEEMRRQNLAMMERAMSLFSPFYRPAEAEPSDPGKAEAVSAEEIAALKVEVAELRAQLAAREVKPLRKV